jgi:8-oxo-dGTP diphosphatase
MADFKIAAKIFLIEDGKVLLLKRTSHDEYKPGIWEIPGGQLELAEDPIEGIKRECMEEINAEVNPCYVLNVKHFKKDRGDNKGQIVTMIIYLGRLVNKQIKLGEEHAEYRWVGMKEAKERITPFFVKEIDLYFELGFDKIIR